jgi:hypothetical protein
LIHFHGDHDDVRPRMPSGDVKGVPFGDTIDSTIVSAWREEVDPVDSASCGAASTTSLPGRLRYPLAKSSALKDKGEGRSIAVEVIELVLGFKLS